MSLSVGIVGLPNSGKSTLFNALLKRQIANVADYPFTTIEPNVGVVEVPDERLTKISQATGIEKTVPAAVKFVDIAGLVKGAYEGEGLGNQFLGHIREVDAILHVVRNFENQKVPHVGDRIDPINDIQTVKSELEFAGIIKPAIFVINVSENQIKNSSLVQTIELVKNEFKSSTVSICAKLEAELSDLSGDEQKAYLREVGIDPSTGSGLSQVIQESYNLLDLITFFTIAGGKQGQAWPIKQGSTMIEAAEKVHTDFARGFITAEALDWQKLVDAGSWQTAKEKGYVHLAGKDEEVTDGEVVEFKFNV